MICNPYITETGCKRVNQETASPIVSFTNKGSQALQNTQEKTFCRERPIQQQNCAL